MIRTAAAQIWFCNQHIQAPTKPMPERFQFQTIGGWIERLTALADIRTFLHGKADEAHARVPVVIGFAAGDSAGQPFLAVKAVTCGNDHIPATIPCQGSPQSFLNRLGAGGGPEDLLQALSTRPALQQTRKSPASFAFQNSDGVIG